MKKQQHYYSANPDAKSDKRALRCRIAGVGIELTTDSGVFSKSQVDFGSRVLIETFLMRESALRGCTLPVPMLDMGCGYGAVGLTVARALSCARVTMADVNERALRLCEENACRNGLSDRVIVRRHDLSEATAEDGPDADCCRYEYVLTNPPIRAGKQTVFGFYRHAHRALKPGGRLYVVIRKQQGASSSKAEIEALFGGCEIAAREAGYWILTAQKSVGGLA